MRSLDLGVVVQKLLGLIPSLPQVANPLPNAFTDVVCVRGRGCHHPSMAIGLRLIRHEMMFCGACDEVRAFGLAVSLKRFKRRRNVSSGGLKLIKAAGLMMLFVSTQFYSLSAAPVPQDRQQMRPSVPHGTVRHFAYTTTVAKNLPFAREDYYVYTPPGYDPAAKTKYPVLYLLHGYEQGASAWIKSGRANLAMDALIAMRKARPMIVVMPRCYGDNKFLLGGFLVWGFPEKVDAKCWLVLKNASDRDHAPSRVRLSGFNET